MQVILIQMAGILRMSQIGHKSQQENKSQQAEYHCLAENPQEQMFTREIRSHGHDHSLPKSVAF